MTRGEAPSRARPIRGIRVPDGQGRTNEPLTSVSCLSLFTGTFDMFALFGSQFVIRVRHHDGVSIDAWRVVVFLLYPSLKERLNNKFYSCTSYPSLPFLGPEHPRCHTSADVSSPMEMKRIRSRWFACLSRWQRWREVAQKLLWLTDDRVFIERVDRFTLHGSTSSSLQAPRCNCHPSWYIPFILINSGQYNASSECLSLFSGHSMDSTIRLGQEKKSLRT